MTARGRQLWTWIGYTTVGCVLGLALHLTLPNPVIGRDTPALAEFRSMLGCYAQRLNEFSNAATTFSNAEFRDWDGLIESATPLKPIILNENAAYATLSQNRFALLADISSQGGRVRDVRDVSRLLEQVDEFQWKRLRPVENAVLVDIIAAWQGNKDASTLQRIRLQQRDGWLDLRKILALHGSNFAAHASTPRCEATGR
jgi:hypothetical protein